MTQISKKPAPPRTTPPTSKLAIAALVLAVMPGCPLVNLVGALLGLTALRRIRATPERLGGRRLAIVAVVVAWMFAALWTGVWVWTTGTVQRGIEGSMIEMVEGVLRDDSADRAAARGSFVGAPGSETPTTGAIVEFGAEVERRYGDLERVSITSMSTDGAVVNPVYAASLVLYFRDGQRPASARFQMPMGTIQLRLVRLVVIDAKAGDLELPAHDGGGEPPATRGAPAEAEGIHHGDTEGTEKREGRP